MILALPFNPSIDVSAATGTVSAEHKLRCTDVRRDPGGGAINVARVLRRFGAECRALYPAGGVLGTLLRRLLEEEGIEGEALGIAAETRESFTILERSSGREFRFVLPGPRLAQAEWQACLDAVAALPRAPEYLVASGSLPPGAPEDWYARLARIARERGSRMVLDASGAALASVLPVASWAGIVALLVVQQAAFFLRAGLRVALWSGEIALVESLDRRAV